jgi:hypothetical protein
MTPISIQPLQREDIRRIVANWMNPQYMKLHAGEMTAQEVRTVRAIVDCVGREIDALLIGTQADASKKLL